MSGQKRCFSKRSNRFWIGLACLGLMLALPAAAAAQPVSVQVFQDEYRFADLAGGELAVRVRVANAGGESAENLVLRWPSLGPILLSSSQPALADGEDRIWPLGSLVDGDSYELRLRLAASGEGTLTAGPELTCAVSGQRLFLVGRSIKLYGPEFPAEFLAATPDADPADPPVSHRAGTLGGDAQYLFEFVRDEVSHQPYAGSLHGARGTLYGLGGNAVDRTNLLVALLRASGIPAGYRRGNLDEAGLDRLEAGMFPAAGTMDRAGLPVDLGALRADPIRLLGMLDPSARSGLGDTRSAQLAALTTLGDAELEALLFEQPSLPAELREHLRDHLWAEAWIDNGWVALDPSFPDAAVGEQVVSSASGELAAAVPEELRHRVSVRLVYEDYQPAWDQELQLHPPVLTVNRGAGDLVGRSLISYQDIEAEVVSGMIFFTASTHYTPILEIHDLEHPTEREVMTGEAFEEFASNFGGALTDIYATSLWLEVELLAPGQVEGQGETHRRPLADRLGEEARAGLPYDSGDADFGQMMIDPLDVSSLLVQAAPVPARLTRARQVLLRAVVARAQEISAEMALRDPEEEPTPEESSFHRHMAAQLTTTELLLYGSNFASRVHILGQLKGQRPYNFAPRVLLATAHISPEAVQSLGLDLVREQVQTLGLPGQLVRDRRTFQSGYGLTATSMEAALMERMSGLNEAVSTGRVFAEARQQGIPFTYLEGSVGLYLVFYGALDLPLSTQLRIYRALEAGLAVYAPTATVTLGGQPRAAWMEMDGEGRMIGRLDDGTGGAAFEYALLMNSVVCAVISCPSSMGYAATLQKVNGMNFGMITGGLAAANACAGGDRSVCEKLASPGFGDVIQELIKEMIETLGTFIGGESDECTTPISILGSVPWPEGSAMSSMMDPMGSPLPYGPADVVQFLYTGYCNFVNGFAQSVNAITNYVTDPILDGTPQGVMDDGMLHPADRHLAEATVPVSASLQPAAVQGSLELGHLRIVGQQGLTWGAGDLVVLARSMYAPAADAADGQGTVYQDAAVSWNGFDNGVVLSDVEQAGLEGEGTLDIYGGLLAGGLSAQGSFGDLFAPDAPGAYSLALAGGTVTAAMDTAERPVVPVQVAGDLSVDALPVTPGPWTVQSEQLHVGGAFAGPLGVASVEILLEHAAVSLADVQGSLLVDGQPQSADTGLSLAGASGTIALFHADGQADQANLDLTGAEQVLLSSAPSIWSGAGPFTADLDMASSLSGDFLLRVAAPEGWRATLDGTQLQVLPDPRTVAGDYAIRVTVDGPGGLASSLAIPCTYFQPSAPEVQLRLVEDPRNSVDVDGARLAARLLEVRHLGPSSGSYALSVSASDPVLAPQLALDAVEVAPGETRRVGLILAPQSAGAWPTPGTPYSMTITAEGPASGQLVVNEEMPSLADFSLAMEPRDLMIPPGASATALVRLHNTGNAAAAVNLALDAPSDLILALEATGFALVPGESRSLTLQVQAPAGMDAAQPRDLFVVVSREPTAFEQARGLEPGFARLRVTVAQEGTVGLLDALNDALSSDDLEAGQSLVGLIHELLSAQADCDDQAVANLRAQVESLIALLSGRPDTQDLVDSLTGVLDRLYAEGCLALAADAPPLFDDALLADARLGEVPNLLASITVPAQVHSGEPVSIQGAVLNAGPMDAGPFAFELGLRRGNDAEATLRRVELDGLAAGETELIQVSWDTSEALGSYVATVRADEADAVIEISENDNVDHAAVMVLPATSAPDDNQPPAFTSAPVTQVIFGQDYSYLPTADDPDGDPVFFALTSRPAGLRMQGGEILGRPTTPGLHTVVLVAMDVYGATTEQAFELDVVEADLGNRPPVVISRPLRLLVADTPWDYALLAEDPDGDPVSWQLDSGPVGASLVDEVLSWTPSAADEGMHWFALTATDGAGGEAAHHFPVTVSLSAQGPDLAVVAMDRSGVVVDAAGQRSGLLNITVANLGDTPSAATDLVVFEEEDGLSGFDPALDEQIETVALSALDPGQVISLDVTVSGQAAFVHNVLFCLADAGQLVAEPDEANNLRFDAQVDWDQTLFYAAFLPVYTGERPDLVLMAPERSTGYQIFDPISAQIVQTGVLEPRVPTAVAVEMDDGQGGTYVLEHFAIEADGPIQAYHWLEILDPDFGADFFHPTVDGQRVGRHFVLWIPTLTPNNALVITALEPSLLRLFDESGVELASIDLGPGDWWEPSMLLPSTIYELEATGNLSVQSSSVTGFSAVPPRDSALDRAGDVGQDFLFSLRSRGPGGGALAVFGYADANYTVKMGEVLLASGQVAEGGFAFHSNLGDHRAVRLQSDGPVSVVAGDIASSGADRIGLMGEDVTQGQGRAGLDHVIHSMESLVGDSVILAGASGGTVYLDGVPQTLAPFGALTLTDNQAMRIAATRPVTVELQGGGDRYFDMGDLLRPIPSQVAEARGSLDRVAIEAAGCARLVNATGRLGSHGSAPLPAGSIIELIQVEPGGVQVINSLSPEEDLLPGRWIDFVLSGQTTTTALQRSYKVRLLSEAGGAVLDTSDGGLVGAVDCHDRPPYFTSVPPLTAVRLQVMVYDAVAVDPEQGPIAYALQQAPAGADLDPATGRLRWIPAAGNLDGQFVLAAVDDQGQSGLQLFSVALSDAPACDPTDDGDGDGFCPPVDCDDNDATVNPQATEIPGDGVDNDCLPQTPDDVPAAQVGLSLDSVAATYPSSTPVELMARVENRSAVLHLSGVVLAIQIFCDGQSLQQVDLPVPTLGPGAHRVLVHTWLPAVSEADCRAEASLSAAGAALASAGTQFRIFPFLLGAVSASPAAVLPGEAVNLQWRLTNPGAVDLNTSVLLADHAMAGAFVDTTVTVPAMGEHLETTSLDTTELRPALYMPVLLAGTALVGQTAFRVKPTDDHLTGPAVPEGGDALDSLGASSYLVFQALGVQAGSPAQLGALRAAWSADGVTLQLSVADLSPDDADSVELSLALSGDDSPRLVASWNRAAGGQGSIEPPVYSADEAGYVLVWTIPATALGVELTAGLELPLRVAVRDGELDRPRDVRIWAADLGEVDDMDRYGILELLAAESDGGLDGGPDGSDAGPDGAGGDLDVDAGTDDGGATDGGLDASDTGDAGDDDANFHNDSGCGCAASGADSGSAGTLLVLLLGALGWFAARRRAVGRRGLAWLPLMALVGLLGAGCSDTASNQDDDGGHVDAAVDAAVDADDGGGDEDAGEVDADDGGANGDAEVDAGEIDAGDGGEADGGGDLPPDEEGEIGDACETDEDCQSGICQHGPDFSLCTRECELYDCPEGWTCERFPAGGQLCVATRICLDEDGDSYGLGRACLGLDCDDAAADVNPGVEETCDGRDEDCDGETDEGLVRLATAWTTTAMATSTKA